MTKVLIVDDSLGLRSLLNICFAAAGLEVIEAADGRQALQAVELHEPTIIILDVMLPDMSGIEVCNLIRSEPCGATSYVIMLSARNDSEDKISGLESGADAYLTKPIEADEVMAQLRVGLRTVEDRRNSLLDPLTGIFGRRAFDHLLNQTIARSRRYNTALTLAMIDIDNFKSVNDTCGHVVGDTVLKKFSELLRDQSRQSDLYFRWGGEEFAWLLSETDARGAAIAAERFRTAVSDYTFEDVGTLTTSIGVAVLTADEDSGSLCRRADDALYRAKKTGRNRIVFSQIPVLAVNNA